VTILSQNTSDHNSRIAYASLMSRFGGWQAVADAGVDEIEDAIRMGGLSRVKAPRIRQILREISVQRGSFDLSFLAELPAGEAKAWLQRLPGVGPKTAACVLLFSLGMPVLPVDTHIFRVAKRLGLIPAKSTAGDAHDLLGEMVPPEDVYRFHILMIEHGRRTCRAQNPRCPRCVLLPGCPSGQFLLGTSREVSVKW